MTLTAGGDAGFGLDGLVDRVGRTEAFSLLSAAGAYGFAGVSASTLNKQPTLADILKNVSASGEVIPIVYGAAQIGGKPFAIDYDSGTWTVGYVVALGEINSYTDVWMNGEAPAAGVSINYYTGTTSQTADPLLAAAISGYADTMVITDPAGDVGVAYIVIQYTDEEYDTWPTIICEIEGRKVWNPKTSTTVYSTNPALHLGDLISSTSYGLGRTIDDTTLEALQDDNDDTTSGEVRRTSYIVIDRPQKTEQWVEILRAYSSCWLAHRGDTTYFISDRPASSVMTITADDVLAGSIRIRKKDSSDLPTVIRASYTDTSGDEWVERLCDPAKAAGVDLGTTPWRESRIRLGGIDRHSQAYRECVERLNKLTLSDLEVSWVQFDEAMSLEAGDVVTLTHPYGLTSKLLRLTESPVQASPGRWSMRAVEYDSAAYSDVVVTTPSYPDANLPAGGVPGAPTGLTIGETTYQLNNGEYASRLDISWTAPTSSIVSGYYVEITEGVMIVWSGTTYNIEAATAPLKELVNYTISVSAFNSLYSGVPVQANYSIIGKTAIPAAPVTFTGFEAGGEVRLKWSASTDVDAKRYAIRYGDTTGSWATATEIDIVDSLRLITKDVPPSDTSTGGVWRFYVKTIDSILQESTTATTLDITVTLDDDAFRAGGIDPLTAGTPTLMHETIEVRGSGITQYYSDGGDTWSSLFSGAAMSTFTNSLVSYQTAAGTSYWYSTELDMSQDNSGTFQANISVTDHNGTATQELGLKPDAGAYTYGALSQTGTARYAKVRVQSAGIFQIAAPSGSLTMDVVAREEVGDSTSNAGVKKTITLTNDYTGVRSITIMPEGTSDLTAVFDSITLGNPTTFDVYIFDGGTQVANAFRWSWKGV